MEHKRIRKTSGNIARFLLNAGVEISQSVEYVGTAYWFSTTVSDGYITHTRNEMWHEDDVLYGFTNEERNAVNEFIDKYNLALDLELITPSQR